MTPEQQEMYEKQWLLQYDLLFGKNYQDAPTVEINHRTHNEAFAQAFLEPCGTKRPLWGVFPQGCGRLVRPRP